MALRIYTNTDTISANINLDRIYQSLNRTMNQLSSGLRVSNAADDPSTVGTIMQKQLSYNTQVDMISNAQNALSAMNAYDSAMGEIGNRLQDLSDTAVKATDNTLSNAQRVALWNTFKTIRNGITTYMQNVKFNAKPIMWGSNIISAIIGPKMMSLKFSTQKYMSVGNLYVFSGALASSAANYKCRFSTSVGSAAVAVSAVNAAIKQFGVYRSIIGAQTQALQSVITSLQNQQVFLASDLSSVKDTDMAQAITNFTAQQVISQAATNMLQQAGNMKAQAILKLLG